MQTYDVRRASKAEKFVFHQVKLAENEYARKLRQLANNIVRMSSEMLDGVPGDKSNLFIQLANMIDGYSQAMRPWAEAVAKKMVSDVSFRDLRAWKERSKQISWGLEELIHTAPVGQIMQQRMEAQINLITSIPRNVSDRVHQMAIESMYTGARFDVISKEIQKSADVSVGRANLIARTEVARTATELTRARAQHIGSEQYVWRSAEDEDVRPAIWLSPKARANFVGSHRKLNGKVFSWDNPPVAGQRGERAHAGQIYNCFPGDTIVNLSNGCKRVWRTLHNGPMVVLAFDDKILRATPNHPILTTRGLIPIGEINAGDDIVSVQQQICDITATNADKMFTTFDQLFLSQTDVHVTPFLHGLFNFHGDIPDSDIYEIRTTNLLPYDRHAMRLEDVCKFVLSDSNMSMRLSDIGSVSDVSRISASRSLHFDSSLVDTSRRSGKSVGICNIVNRNAVLFQSSDDCYVADAVLRSNYMGISGDFVPSDNVAYGQFDSIAAPAAVIDPDASQSQPLAQRIASDSSCTNSIVKRSSLRYNTLRVVNKSIIDFSGHVYTMESYTGYYGTTSSSIASANCRCIPEPIIADSPPDRNNSWRYVGGR